MPDPNLMKLQQISELRKRRSERVLQEAKSALSEAEQAKILAEQELLREQARLNDAKVSSYQNPSSEQAWIWQAAKAKSEQSAAYQHEQKTENASLCLDDVKIAGQGFLKATVKLESLETHNRQLKKAEEKRLEDLQAEEQQDLKSNGLRVE